MALVVGSAGAVRDVLSELKRHPEAGYAAPDVDAVRFAVGLRGEVVVCDRASERGAGRVDLRLDDDRGAADFAAMLLRMYLRWAERKGFEVEVLDSQPGEISLIFEGRPVKLYWAADGTTASWQVRHRRCWYIAAALRYGAAACSGYRRHPRCHRWGGMRPIAGWRP